MGHIEAAGPDVGRLTVPFGFNQWQVVRDIVKGLANRFQRHTVFAGKLLGSIRVGTVYGFVDNCVRECGGPGRTIGDSWSLAEAPSVDIGWWWRSP